MQVQTEMLWQSSGSNTNSTACYDLKQQKVAMILDVFVAASSNLTLHPSGGTRSIQKNKNKNRK